MANPTSSYINSRLPELAKILEPYLKANEDKHFKYFAKHCGEDKAKIYSSVYGRISLTHLDDGYDHCGFGLGCPELFSFNMERYPACCGAYMLYAFGGGASSECWRDLLFWIVDELGVNPEQEDNDEDDYDDSVDMYMNNKRLIINMVERRRDLPDGDRRLMDFPPIENPKMEYQNLYDCFTKYCAKVNDRIFYNVNTGNLIHDMEVIVK